MEKNYKKYYSFLKNRTAYLVRMEEYGSLPEGKSSGPLEVVVEASFSY